MDINNHPCFNDSARHRSGRLHLPVAPACNMQCNYCRRDLECVNELRPGVSRRILKPTQALAYLDAALEKMKNISVVGIAGPGDPLANGAQTLETLRLVREKYPDMLLCIATNGMELPRYAEELARLNVSHVTVTVNAIDAEIGAKIYVWVRHNRKMYHGIEAGRIIADKQMKGILRLKKLGVTVKVNTVVISGINDSHVSDIAQAMQKAGVDIMNCIPMYRIEGTAFESIAPPEPSVVNELRRQAGAYIPQMNHCSRCRADAAGLIGEAPDGGIQTLLDEAAKFVPPESSSYVAVASRGRLLCQ
jgi:nitrogen fixation protein NifB